MNVFAFSGGKDSTALLLWAKEQGFVFGGASADRPAVAVFCDTGWEHPLTYQYVERINQQVLDGSLVVLRSERWFRDGGEGMRTLVRAKGRVPSARARFCTEQLKVFPMRDYLAGLADPVVYVGIRAEESAARARLAEREWSDVYDAWVERPLLRWTTDEVFHILDRHGIPPNPLYRMGAKRVGCFPCIFVTHGELQRLSRTAPEVWDRIEALEQLSGRSFFAPGYIPDAHTTGVDPASGKRFPRASDVRRYVLDVKKPSLDLWDEAPGCLSVYNLCE